MLGAYSVFILPDNQDTELNAVFLLLEPGCQNAPCVTDNNLCGVR